MFYNAFGNLEKKERNTEHFTISDIRYKNTKFIDNKDDPLYAQYYEDKKAREEKSRLAIDIPKTLESPNDRYGRWPGVLNLACQVLFATFQNPMPWWRRHLLP